MSESMGRNWYTNVKFTDIKSSHLLKCNLPVNMNAWRYDDGIMHNLSGRELLYPLLKS